MSDTADRTYAEIAGGSGQALGTPDRVVDAENGGGGGGGVTSFDGRTGAVSPQQADYDAFFLTQAEGDAAYAPIAEPVAAAHIADGTDAHAATAIGNTPAGGIAATTVQAAINELDTEKADVSEPIAAAHISDATDAHDASAVSIADAGGYFTATDVEAALQELAVVPHCATFSRAGTAVVLTGSLRRYVKGAWTITEVRASVGTGGEPSGASLIVDVNKNGTTIFTTQSNRPTIAAGTNTDLADAIDVTALADADYLTVDIDQIGSVNPGINLVVQVWMVPA